MTDTDARPASRASRAGVFLAFLLLDLVYCFWLWKHFDGWGIWDWDYKQSLLEAARLSILEYGQLPLWNPYVGGGVTLVGHPAGRGFEPSFLPVLAFGTIHGVKLSILLHMGVAQAGMLAWARAAGLSRCAGWLAAVVFALGGVQAQHLAHGHLLWIGHMWLPCVLWALWRAARELSARNVALGGLFLGLTFLDGGPYQLAFPPLFLGVIAAGLAARDRSARPLLAVGAFGAVAAAVAAIQLLPILETIARYPRPTVADKSFYGAPFEPTAWGMLWDGLLSRAQAHDEERYMPYAINVGMYVGFVPLGLALLGLVRDWRALWPVGAALGFSLWLFLGPAAPVDLWALLHALPGFASLQVPARFNVYALLCLALLAGRGLQGVTRVASPRWAQLVQGSLLAFVAVDLLAVNAPVYEVAFSVRPIEVQAPGTFRHRLRSPYEQRYREHATLPVFPNWPNATYPAVLENTGVIRAFHDISYERKAIPLGDRRHPGAEVWAAEGELEVLRSEVTPNRVEVEVRGDGLLVVNQNFDPNWQVAGAGNLQVEPIEGLVGVRVPPGARSVLVEYSPPAFRVGALVSALTLVAVAALLGASRRRAPARSAG